MSELKSGAIALSSLAVFMIALVLFIKLMLFGQV